MFSSVCLIYEHIILLQSCQQRTKCLFVGYHSLVLHLKQPRSKLEGYLIGVPSLH